MDNKKVYLNIVHLLFNVIKNDKTKYYLAKDQEFKKKYTAIVNLLILLESEQFKFRFNRKRVAEEFAKAYVKITKESSRFEIPEELFSITKIEEEYIEFANYIISSFKIMRKTLVNEDNEITPELILTNAKVNQDYVAKMDEKIAKEAAAKQATEPTPTPIVQPQDQSNDSGYKQTDFNQNQNQFQQNQFGKNPFAQNVFGQNAMGGMPAHPTTNPKFYPFRTKPTGMPVMKKILGVISILAAIMIMVAMIYMTSVKIIMKDDYLDALFGTSDWKEAKEVWWISSNGANRHQINSENIVKILQLDRNLAGGTSSSFTMILTMLIYFMPTFYVNFNVWSKQNNAKNKYRMSTWSVVFMIFFSIYIILMLVNYSSIDLIRNTDPQKYNAPVSWKWYSHIVLGKNDELDPAKYAAFWTSIYNDHASQFSTLISLSIVAIVLTSANVFYAIVLLFVNPKLDREKIMRANIEYQKAVAAAMNGQSYTMDQTLFDDDDHEQTK